MKVIDLLNKVANGEEVPRKIRISGWCYEFEWMEHLDNYYDKNAGVDLMCILSMCSDELNREVEIIEENNKIEKLNKNHFHKKQRQLANKINEIIDKINEMSNDKN